MPFIMLRKTYFNYSKILLVSIFLYAVFLAGIPFQNSRFLLLSFPLVLILFYPSFIYLSKLKWLKKLFVLGVAFAIVIQFFLTKKLFRSVLQRNKLEIEIVEILKKYQYNTLYSFDIDIALQGRDLQFNYNNLWKNRYIDLKTNDLILFHPTKFKKQWQGKNPMLNFNYFKKTYTLRLIEDLPEGWKLFKVIIE